LWYVGYLIVSTCGKHILYFSLQETLNTGYSNSNFVLELFIADGALYQHAKKKEGKISQS